MQQKRPHLNPLILALALAAVLMIWSVFTTSNTPSGTTMSYSTVVHYFEHLQVTAFTLDRNTGVITMNIKEGDLPLPEGAGESAPPSGGGGWGGAHTPPLPRGPEPAKYEAPGSRRRECAGSVRFRAAIPEMPKRSPVMARAGPFPGARQRSRRPDGRIGDTFFYRTKSSPLPSAP